MPVEISHYQQVLQEAGSLRTAGKTVHLSKSGDDLVLRGSSFLGRMASWFKGFRASDHAAVKQRFIAVLALQYGQGIANQVSSEYKLNDANCIKKPLTSREVFLVFTRASQYEEIKSEKKENSKGNNLLALQYDASPEVFLDSEFESADHKFSQILPKVIANDEGNHAVDAQEVLGPAELKAAGEEIKQQILKKGDDGRHRVKEKEADGIAEQVLREAVVEKYKKTVLNKYLIPRDLSQDGNEIPKLVSQMNRQPDAPNLDLTKLLPASIDAINEGIEADIISEMYQENPDKPVLLSEDRVAEIAERNMQALVPVMKAVQKLDLPDLNSMTPPQLKNIWEAGLKVQPHLKVLADADKASEKELKTAMNGYIDALATLEAEVGSSEEAKKAGSLLMMMAQGGDSRATMEKMYRQITAPGVFNSYLRTMNHYRLNFLIDQARVGSDNSYQSSEQRSKTFCRWTSALGLGLAQQLKIPQGAEKVMAQSRDLPSSLAIDDQMLNLMRNTGIKVLAPDRLNQQGSGVFCDEAVKHMEKKLASGVIGKVKDDICEQFLLDIGVRATAYFNGEKVEADNVADALKEFCTDESGALNRDMLFAVSQMHQGVFSGPYSALLREEIAPIYGIVTGNDGVIYHFNKNDDGSVSVKAVSKKINSQVFSSMKAGLGDVFLDETRSGFEVGLELRLSPDKFTAARDRYIPPEVINANYQYSLYTKNE